jgi:hypothetical protein
VRTARALILLLLVAIVTDFTVLTEGAFRFNTDESMVGVPAGVRVTSPAIRPESVTPPRIDATPIVVSRVPHGRRPTVLRADVLPARSALLASADDRPPDAH